MGKRNWKLVLVMGSLALLALTGCTSTGGAQASEATYETATVKRETLRSSVEGSGNLSANSESYVAFQSSGTVAEILVETGDEVKAGDVLVKLDTTDTERSLKDAELQVEIAKVSLESAQLNLDDLMTWEPDEDAVALAEANLNAAYTNYNQALTSAGQRDDQLTSAQVRLTQAERSLADAQENWDSAYDPGREWELGDRFRSGLLETEREVADDALLRAQEDYEVALADYNLNVTNVSDSGVSSAWSSVVNSQVSLNRETEAPDEDDITAMEIQVEQAELSLQQAELKYASALETLENMTLVAPINGVVTEINLELGLNAVAGQTAIVIADLTNLVVEIDLDESDIIEVSLGQPATLMIDAFDANEINGEVSHIAPAATLQSGVVLYEVEIAVAPTALEVRAGMTTDVEIITASTEGALTIPLKAIRSEEDGTYVVRELHAGESAPHTQEGIPDGYTLVKVELGTTSNNVAEITSGLEEGDTVYIPLTVAKDEESNGFMMGGGMGRP